MFSLLRGIRSSKSHIQLYPHQTQPQPHSAFVPRYYTSHEEVKPLINSDQEIHKPLNARGEEDFGWLDSILDEETDPWVRGKYLCESMS